MSRITAHIKYLLRSTDCVSVPGFGAFIVQHIPARYDSASETFFPPRREIVFNSAVCHNDGVLISSIARKESISAEAATRIVASEVEAFLNQLSSDGEVAFGNIGFFSHESGKNVFHPNAEKNFLNPIAIAPYIKPEVVSTETEFEKGRSHLWVRPLQIAASIIVLFILGILFSTPISVEHSTIAYAKSGLPEISMPKKAVIIDSLAVELNIAIPTDEDATAIFEAPACNYDSFKYGLVVASLANHKQAEEFIAAHPGHNLAVINSAGRIRIIAAGSNSLAELQTIAESQAFKKEFPQSWPCRK